MLSGLGNSGKTAGSSATKAKYGVSALLQSAKAGCGPCSFVGDREIYSMSVATSVSTP